MRYIFVIAVTLAFWPLGWLPDWLFACSLLAFTVLSREVNPPQRRPGYVTFGPAPRNGGSTTREPSVSEPANQGTGQRVVTYMGCSPAGLKRVAPAELRTRLGQNRITALTVSGNGLAPASVTVTQPGTHTTVANG